MLILTKESIINKFQPMLTIIGTKMFLLLMNVHETVSGITQAILVSEGRVLLSGAVGIGMNKVGNMVGSAIGDVNVGRYLGLGLGIIGSALTYKGFSALDKRYNWSGYYKTEIHDINGTEGNHDLFSRYYIA